MVSNLLNDIAVMIGIGMFLDFVLIGQDERNKISAYLQSDRQNKGITRRFQEFLLIGHSIAFGRFFSSKALSQRFFLSASAVSLASFAIVVTVQISADQSFLADVRFDLLQVSVILVFLLFNITFDYFTIVQTKIFIEAASRAQSISRSVLFIVSDIIVTMNTFILAFAAFSVVVAQYFIWPTESLTVVREKSWFELVRALDEPPREFADFWPSEAIERIKFQATVQSFLFARDGGEFEGDSSISFYSSFDPRIVDPFPTLFNSLSRLTVVPEDGSSSFSSIESTYVREKVREFASPFQTVLPDAEAAERPLPQVEGMDFSVTGGIRGFNDLNAAYTITFAQVDMLEDGFPDSVFGSLQSLSLREFVAEAVSFDQFFDPVLICLSEDEVIAVLRLSSGNASLLKSCPEFLLVDATYVRRLNREYSVAGRDLEDRVVPFNTLMITSLLPTLVFYTVCLLLALCTFFFETVVKGTQRAQRFFLKAPLALTCVLLAVPLSLLGWI